MLAHPLRRFVKATASFLEEAQRLRAVRAITALSGHPTHRDFSARQATRSSHLKKILSTWLQLQTRMGRPTSTLFLYQSIREQIQPTSTLCSIRTQFPTASTVLRWTFLLPLTVAEVEPEYSAATVSTARPTSSSLTQLT